jgi:hypothetical protein
MSQATLNRYMIMLVLPNTRNKSIVRKSMIASVRKLISNLESIQDAKVVLKSRIITAEKKPYLLVFDSSKLFTVTIVAEYEDSTEEANKIFNEVCLNLNQANLLEKESAVNAVTVCEFSHPADSNLFSNLINSESIKRLSCAAEEVVIPRRVELVCYEKEATKMAYSLFTRKKDKIVEISFFKKYEGEFPSDVVRNSLNIIKKRGDELAKKLIEGSK